MASTPNEEDISSYWEEFRKMDPARLTTEELISRIFTGICVYRQIRPETELVVKYTRKNGEWSAFFCTEEGAGRTRTLTLSGRKSTTFYGCVLGLYNALVVEIDESVKEAATRIANEQARLEHLQKTRAVVVE